jgi:hypothetical protein
MNRLRTIWRLLNLPCEGVSRLTSRSLDGELGRMERFALWSHLLYCVACRRYRRQLRLIQCAMRELAARIEVGGPLPGPGLPDEVRERIKRALKDF